jgi:quinol-cytochrome oxidoreductase complex cytochrome b subunit
MNYKADILLAFSSIENIVRETNYGWLLRYLHSNGASFFFIIVYCHISKNLYYGSFAIPRHYLWFSGVIIFILMMATAFLGYVLPFGQMSFWGATVITSLFSVIPFIGEFVVHWIWGGFSVINPTLNRFFALHFLLPFVLAGLSFIHLYLLHSFGSSNLLGINSKTYSISFFPYFWVKDLHSFVIFLFFFSIFVFFSPNFLGHSDNYIEANPMVTPHSIVPEWYFLPYYCILRAIPNKLLGVLLMFSSLLVLFFLPFISNTKIRSTFYRPLYKIVYWVLVFTFLLLGWFGAQSPEEPFIIFGQMLTFFYFFLFLVCIPFVEFIESLLVKDITKNVT